MIEYINSFLLLTVFGIIYCIFLRAISIVMDSVILNQLNNLAKDVDSDVKVIEPRRGRKKKINTKTLPKMNKILMT